MDKKYLIELLGKFVISPIIVLIIGYYLKNKNLFKRLAARYKLIDKIGIKQSDLESIIQRDFKKSKEVKFLVIRGLATISMKDSLLRKIIENKNSSDFSMEILMLHPNSKFCKDRAKRIGETESQMSSGIRHSITQLKELSRKSGVNIDIYLYDEEPIWRYMFIDDILYLGTYPDSKDGYDSLILRITNKELYLYDAHRKNYDNIKRRSVRVDSMYLLTPEEAIEYMKEYGCSEDIINHNRIVSDVAVRIAERAFKDKNIDLYLVEMGALLHDMGKAKSSKLDHAVIAAEYIRSSKKQFPNSEFREALARIVERHIGTGLTKEQVAHFNSKYNLNIPEKDYIPETHEEKIVALADKMVEKDKKRTIEEKLKKEIRERGFEDDYVNRLKEWKEEYMEYLEGSDK